MAWLIVLYGCLVLAMMVYVFSFVITCVTLCFAFGVIAVYFGITTSSPLFVGVYFPVVVITGGYFIWLGHQVCIEVFRGLDRIFDDCLDRYRGEGYKL